MRLATDGGAAAPIVVPTVRLCDGRTTFQVAAPASVQTEGAILVFDRWTIDGEPQAAGDLTLKLSVEGDREAVAGYVASE